MEKLTTYADQLVRLLIDYAPKFISAIVVLLIGLWLIAKLVKLSQAAFERRNYEKSLITFLRSIISLGLKIILIISVAGMVGIQTTSVIALLGAAGLAVGLALQGSLANFAGGVLLLIFKPFKVGDRVEAQGQTGMVTEIQIFHTILNSDDNKTIIIPNGPLLNGVIVNAAKSQVNQDKTKLSV